MSGCAGEVVRFGTLEVFLLSDELECSDATDETDVVDEAGAADEAGGEEDSVADGGDTLSLELPPRLLATDGALTAATLPADEAA